MKPIIQDRLDWISEDDGLEQEREHKQRKEALENAWREALLAQRSVLMGLYQENTISTVVYAELAEEVDQELVRPFVGAFMPIQTEEGQV